MLSNYVRSIGVLVLLGSQSANAIGVLVQKAVIESVGLTWNEADTISLEVSNGTGPCADSTIELNENNFILWPNHFDRTYSMLMSAFLSGKPVDVYGLSAENCGVGSFVYIHK